MCSDAQLLQDMTLPMRAGPFYTEPAAADSLHGWTGAVLDNQGAGET